MMFAAAKRLSGVCGQEEAPRTAGWATITRASPALPVAGERLQAGYSDDLGTGSRAKVAGHAACPR
jgi:hypothetical protein